MWTNDSKQMIISATTPFKLIHSFKHPSFITIIWQLSELSGCFKDEKKNEGWLVWNLNEQDNQMKEDSLSEA